MLQNVMISDDIRLVYTNASAFVIVEIKQWLMMSRSNISYVLVTDMLRYSILLY